MLLSEMLGVERDTDFGVEGYSFTFKIATFLGEYEHLMHRWSADLDWREAEVTMLCRVIAAAPSGIIHRPLPLTNEQREQLKALWALGGRWLAKGDLLYGVYAFTERPVKSACTWCSGGGSYNVLRDNSVCDLVSWSDNEPYDIGKALGVGE